MTKTVKTIKIKAYPGSKENSITKEVDLFGDTTYKIRTTKVPKDGKANESIIEIIAEYFNVSKSSVKIISGQSSRNKIINIDTV